MKRVATILCLAAFCMVFAGAAMAQTSTSGSMQGTVLDPDGKAVVGATVTITNTATGTVLPAVKTGGSGDFSVANLSPGIYSVEITMANFKTAKISNIEIVLGRTYNLSQKLELGIATANVTVEAGGQQVIETSNTSVQNTVTGRRITDLPFASRSAILMGVLDPGAQTLAGPRNTVFEGLPKGAVNITFDGINNQDNLLKSSDGFFANQDARIDDVQEFGITTNANDPSKNGEGAVQMNIVSRAGGNAFHGGVWEYNRNTIYDANYYFSNLAGTPRPILKLNEFGYKIGGPILKNKLFFFTDLEFFQFPQSVARQDTILSTLAASGTYTYNINGTVGSPIIIPAGDSWLSGPGCTAGSTVTTTVTCHANLLAMAATAPGGFPSTINPIIGGVLAQTQSVRTAPGVSISPTPPSPFQDNVFFNDSSMGVRRFPDIRIDYNITKHQSLELDYHYTFSSSFPDLLNGVDNTYPVAPFNTNQGAQISNRNLFVGAWRWNIGSNKTNELRVGFGSSPTNFGIGLNVGFYPTINTNLTTPGNPIIYTFTPFGESSPFFSLNSLQGRNTAYGQAHDGFSWTIGTHQLSFGYDQTSFRFNDFANVSASVTTGITSGDPIVAGLFTTTGGNLPGIGSSDLSSAEGLYASLTGRVSGFITSVRYSPTTGTFLTGAPRLDKVTQTEMGFYGGDSWRVRPSLTFNYGLRWEYEGWPVDQLAEYFLPQNGVADIFGVSGTGNVFKPGVLAGPPISFYNRDNTRPFANKYYRGLAPSVGFAWSPNSDNRMFKHLIGGAGKTVFRAGYSIAYSREGLQSYNGVVQNNPGGSGAQSSVPGVATNAAIGQFAFGTLLNGTTGIQGVLQNPSSFVSQFPVNPNAPANIVAANPNLHPPMIQSWQAGIQRELSPSMALEIRYQANHSTGLWNLFGINEVNVFENGFLTEFNNAVSNMALCNASLVACKAAQAADGVSAGNQTGNNFADWGLPGQVPLPTMTAAFNAGLTSATLNTASAAGSPQQANSSFRSSTFVTPLNLGGVGSFAGTLSPFTSSGAFLKNMISAGFPSNFFQVNPFASPFVFANANQSTYNALVVDFRRRPSKGLQFDLSYTFAKALTDFQATGSQIQNGGFTTLRNISYNKGPAPFDIRHAIKLQTLYEFPFGEGRKWSSSSRFVNRLIGGWQFNGITRWQTGTPIQITSGLSGGNTFNSGDPGTNLVGLTPNQLQGMLQINKAQGPGFVYYVPASLLDSSLQRANTAIIQPCKAPGTLCSRLFVYGPQFMEADWNIAKVTKITEHVNFEMRMEALNVFNNQNFFFGCPVSTDPSACSISTQSQNFGRMGGGTNSGAAYQDLSTTQFPGGRVIQLVGRINF